MVNDYLTMDMSVSLLSKLSEKISEYEQETIVELSGTTSVVDNHIQFEPYDVVIKEIVLDNFYAPVQRTYRTFLTVNT